MSGGGFRYPAAPGFRNARGHGFPPLGRSRPATESVKRPGRQLLPCHAHAPASLTERKRRGIHSVAMRTVISACLCFAGLACGQIEPPADVAASAIAAVEELGKQVMLGRHKAAVDKMYPRWKERMAKRAGGMEALERQLDGIGDMMARQGVALRSFRHTGMPACYEVWPGKKTAVENGREVEQLVYEKWLLLIPTETEYRITQPGEPGKPLTFYTITSKGFQVAISDKGKNDWTFIDGASITVADLRSLFITLPEDMKLPPIERKASEVK